MNSGLRDTTETKSREQIRYPPPCKAHAPSLPRGDGAVQGCLGRERGPPPHPHSREHGGKVSIRAASRGAHRHVAVSRRDRGVVVRVQPVLDPHLVGSAEKAGEKEKSTNSKKYGPKRRRDKAWCGTCGTLREARKNKKQLNEEGKKKGK
jgi:hypothetical protein